MRVGPPRTIRVCPLRGAALAIDADSTAALPPPAGNTARASTRTYNESVFLVPSLGVLFWIPPSQSLPTAGGETSPWQSQPQTPSRCLTVVASSTSTWQRLIPVNQHRRAAMTLATTRDMDGQTDSQTSIPRFHGMQAYVASGPPAFWLLALQRWTLGPPTPYLLTLHATCGTAKCCQTG